MFNVTCTLDHFNELSLSCLTGLDSHMKPTTCSTDLISSRLLKEVSWVAVCLSLTNYLSQELYLHFLNVQWCDLC